MHPRRPTAYPVWSPLLLLLLILPALIALFYFDLARQAFERLGLSPGSAILMLSASLLGSIVNIPVSRRKVVLTDPAVLRLPSLLRWLLPVLHFYPPTVAEQVLAINVGGAVVPVVFSIYLCSLPGTSIPAALGAIAIVAAVAKLLARPQPQVGIILPSFIPPLVAAIAAHVLTLAVGGGADPAPVAYIGGTLGTLIGADLLNLPAILRGELTGLDAVPAEQAGPYISQLPAQQHLMLSIGGAGVFDGIFLTGIVAPLLA
ncbi:MAG: DUF1614 domain-containing protein [Sphaerobacter sp.]|nr:DUF1614 domain-containing protein [Sphaerobacter sp.]